MTKRFITIRIWEETKDKLEEIRMKKTVKQKRIVSLAQTLDEMADEYLNKKKTKDFE